MRSKQSGPLGLPVVGTTAVRCALAALMLVGCGSSDSNDGSGGSTGVPVASIGGFRGELAALADQEFARQPLTGNADINLPIVLDGADVDAISDAQWLSIKSAYREGWAVLLLQPTRQQIETLIATLRLHLEVPEDIEDLDAIGYQSAEAGDVEAIFEYIDTDGDPDPDVRVAAISDWVAERQFAAAAEALEVAAARALDVAASQGSGEAPELESVMGSLSKQGSLVVDRAIHVVVVDAWAAHEFATGDDFYVFRLDTRSSGNNYLPRAFAQTRGSGNGITRNQPRMERAAETICESRADATSCVRDRYLRRFEVTLFPYPGEEIRALTLARVTPSSGRESESYTVTTDLSLGGSVNVGFSKEMGANASVGLTAGLSVNHSRTVSIADAVIVANHNAINGSSASWRVEMPDPPVLDLPGCPGRELRAPFTIQRGTHSYEQWAIYRSPASARARLNDELRMVWRIEAGEGRRTLDWVHNGFVATNPGCGGAGCNCRPVTVHHDLRRGGGTFRYPLADNSREEPQRPQLSSISPTAGTAGTPIVLQGSGLDRVTRLFFGASEAQVFFSDSDSRITVLVPANAAGGTVPVSVLGNGGVSNAVQFRYN
jgi:hypothetical protein